MKIMKYPQLFKLGIWHFKPINFVLQNTQMILIQIIERVHDKLHIIQIFLFSCFAPNPTCPPDKPLAGGKGARKREKFENPHVGDLGVESAICGTPILKATIFSIIFATKLRNSINFILNPMNFKKLSKTFLMFLFAGILFSATSQNAGSISESGLNKMRQQFHKDENATARMNAVSSNNISDLSINRENLGKTDTHFSNLVETAGITDQKSTGRCWLFTGLNVFRAKVISENKLEDFSFSHNFNFFYDQLEKANLFLEGIINSADKPMDDKMVDWLFKNPIGDGGQWTGVADIIGKYGLVPAGVFPESYNSENSRIMSRMLRRKLREDGMNLREMFADGKKEKQIGEEKGKMLAEIYQILAISLGEPPLEFQWRFEDVDGNLSELKTYTPKSFYAEFVGTDLDDYIMFMNDPSREYGKLYEIDYDRHIFEGENWKYINLEIEKIKGFAMNSILSDEAMYFSCDVGKQLDKDRGYLDVNNYDYDNLFGVDFGMDKKMRIQTFESGSSHGMALMGVDVIDGKVEKWLLENSWGESGFNNGYLIMTDEWFNEYMFRLVVDKKHIDEGTLEILGQKPILLPPWDPMFSDED